MQTESFLTTSVGAEEKVGQSLTPWAKKEPIENWAMKSVFGQRWLGIYEGCPLLYVRQEVLSSSDLEAGDTQKRSTSTLKK